MEEGSRRTDALVRFLFDGQYIQLHIYHTNQFLMVQGPNHSAFWVNFLLPLLTSMIDAASEEIRQFNCHVIRTLIPGSLLEGHDDSVWRSATPDRRNTLKLIRKSTVACNVCDTDFTSKSQLKVHIDANHGASVAMSAKPRANITSTRLIMTRPAPPKFHMSN